LFLTYQEFYFLSFLSATAQYKAGTTSMETTLMAIPPKEGISMGTIISEPLPVDVSTGIKVQKVVAVVIRQ
jgi:hypothetical protein